MRHKRVLAAVAMILWIACVGVRANTPTSKAAVGRPVEVQMRNVMYHFTDAIAVHIRNLHGELVPTKADFPVFEDKESFTIRIEGAEIAMSTESLASVLNSYVFADRDAPLKNISLKVAKGGRLTVKGKLHNKGDINFETEGRLSATSDGKIRLHAEKVTALHLPVKGIMDLLGIHITNLVKTGKVRGLQVERDDLILDPQTLLPPPHIEGRVTTVRLEAGNIVQVFNASRDTTPNRALSGNYMAYRGNRLRFGKLTMSDTDLVLIDMDPKDPFDFYLDHYREQLVAGYTKETLSFGLRVFMRDYNKLPKNRKREVSKPAN